MAKIDVLPEKTASREKHFIKSKVVWFNLALAILGVIEVVEKANLLSGNMLILIAFIGIFLRFITNQPIHIQSKLQGGQK